MTPSPIPLFDSSADFSRHGDDYRKAVEDVLRSGRFILGPQLAAFEEEVATYLGSRNAIGVNSGTDALTIGLRALGVGAGDEVITTSFTFFATAEAISNVGGVPVFVDIEPSSLNLDPKAVATAITPRTRAIMPVHLFGRAAEMGDFLGLAEHHKLLVIEDTAQAFGAGHQGSKLGSLGDLGAFSFFPTKNLGGFGDGGLIATNDDSVAEEARMLRTHGSMVKYQNEKLGYNSRLDELQAALLRIKLRHVDEANRARWDVAASYQALLEDSDVIETPALVDVERHVFHQYTVRVKNGRRDEVRTALSNQGIATAVYYPVPVHLLPVYASLGYRLESTEIATQEVLSLPIWPFMPEDQIERVADALQTAVR